VDPRDGQTGTSFRTRLKMAGCCWPRCTNSMVLPLISNAGIASGSAGRERFLQPGVAELSARFRNIAGARIGLPVGCGTNGNPKVRKVSENTVRRKKMIDEKLDDVKNLKHEEYINSIISTEEMKTIFHAFTEIMNRSNGWGQIILIMKNGKIDKVEITSSLLVR
jgi:hypothetical protein